MNVVMVVCVLSFGAQAACPLELLALVAAPREGQDHDEVAAARCALAGRVVYAEWLPAVAPSLALLYLIRDANKAGLANQFRPAASLGQGLGQGLAQSPGQHQRSAHAAAGDAPSARGGWGVGAYDADRDDGDGAGGWLERGASEERRSPDNGAMGTLGVELAASQRSRRPGQYELVDDQVH